jgi:hypothetical protein
VIIFSIVIRRSLSRQANINRRFHIFLHPKKSIYNIKLLFKKMNGSNMQKDVLHTADALSSINVDEILSSSEFTTPLISIEQTAYRLLKSSLKKCHRRRSTFFKVYRTNWILQSTYCYCR